MLERSLRPQPQNLSQSSVQFCLDLGLLQEEKGPRKKMTLAGIPSFHLASAVLHRVYVLRCRAEGLQSPAQRRQGPTTTCEL